MTANPGGYVDQVPVGPVILNLSNADAPDAFVIFQLANFFGNKIGGIKGPGYSDERVVFSSSRTFPGQSAVGAVGVAALGVVLEKVDAVATASGDAPGFEPEFDSSCNADTDIIWADPRCCFLFYLKICLKVHSIVLKALFYVAN